MLPEDEHHAAGPPAGEAPAGAAGSPNGVAPAGHATAGRDGASAAGGGSRGYRLRRALIQLYLGLVLFGASIALMVQSGLGLDPWDVFHQGLARQTGRPLGQVVIAVSAVVLLLWFPLRQRPGFGTVSNVVLVGLAVDATLAVLPEPRAIAVRITFMLAAIVGNGVATGLYIGAGLGPGPRDGLMTGLATRGYSIRVARTAIEVAVLGAGWALGGTVGVGTVLYAVSIGSLAHYFIPKFAITPASTEGKRR